jgi:hypothetical protein
MDKLLTEEKNNKESEESEEITIPDNVPSTEEKIPAKKPVQ